MFITLSDEIMSSYALAGDVLSFDLTVFVQNSNGKTKQSTIFKLLKFIYLAFTLKFLIFSCFEKSTRHLIRMAAN